MLHGMMLFKDPQQLGQPFWNACSSTRFKTSARWSDCVDLRGSNSSRTVAAALEIYCHYPLRSSLDEFYPATWHLYRRIVTRETCDYSPQKPEPAIDLST